MGIKKLEVECEALNLIQMFSKHMEDEEEELQILFGHVCREGNRCADALAALCRNQQMEDIIWMEPPKEVVQFRNEDVLGSKQERLLWTEV